MTKKGTEALTSGNLFHWQHVRAAGRGGLTGSFTTDPSDADISEALAFSKSLLPPSVRFGGGVFQAPEQTVQSALDQFVFGGQRN